ncbi:MAG: hypothetical protein Q8L66_04435 [Caulobacter sp.]|nr:hypothetical protein [Caulobacter sp.]
MRLIITTAVAFLFLAACGPQAPGGGSAAPPADAPPVDPAGEYRADFLLIGTEPFWAVEISNGDLKLSRPDHEAVTAKAAVLVVRNSRAVWTAGTGKAGLIVALTPGACSDGMSDRIYPYTAEVKVDGKVMKGCGARRDSLPGSVAG